MQEFEFVDALLEYCSKSNFLQIYKSDFLDLNKYAEGWGKYENLTHRFSVLNQELSGVTKNGNFRIKI